MENDEKKSANSTSSNSVKTTNTKLISIIVVAVLAILVIIFMFFTKSAKSVVKDYIKGMEKCDAKRVMATLDFEGSNAFDAISSYDGNYKFEEFESKYDEIMNKLKEMDKEEKKLYEDAKEEAVNDMQNRLETMKEYNVKYSVKDIKTEKVDNCKALTKVTGKLIVKMDNQEKEQEFTFYTMKKGLKNYIVSTSI